MPRTRRLVVFVIKVVLSLALLAWKAMPVTEWSLVRAALRNSMSRLSRLQSRPVPV